MNYKELWEELKTELENQIQYINYKKEGKKIINKKLEYIKFSYETILAVMENLESE